MKIKVGADGVVTISANGPAITKEVALAESYFHANPCRIEVGIRGSIKRITEVWRRNGVTQTWVTRPGEWRVPVKFGLKSYDQLTPGFSDVVHAASQCPLRDLNPDDIAGMARQARTVPGGTLIDTK